MLERKMITKSEYDEVYVSTLKDLEDLVDRIKASPGMELDVGATIELVTKIEVMETDEEFKRRLLKEQTTMEREFAKYQELKKKFESGG